MKAVKALLRLFSYGFHLALGLFLFVVAALALGSGAHVLQLGMIPWSGEALAWILLVGSLAGLVALALAITGKQRLLFFIWSLVVAVLLIKLYFLSGYRFAPGGARIALELLVASWLAVAGAWVVMRHPAHGKY